jgi:hypothetical protein
MTLWPRIASSPTSPAQRPALVVDDPDLDAVDGQPDRAGLALAIAAVERGDR